MVFRHVLLQFHASTPVFWNGIRHTPAKKKLSCTTILSSHRRLPLGISALKFRILIQLDVLAKALSIENAFSLRLYVCYRARSMTHSAQMLRTVLTRPGSKHAFFLSTIVGAETDVNPAAKGANSSHLSPTLATATDQLTLYSKATTSAVHRKACI